MLVYLSCLAEEALEFGLIDRIVENRPGPGSDSLTAPTA